MRWLHPQQVPPEAMDQQQVCIGRARFSGGAAEGRAFDLKLLNCGKS
jgi:hypothetical protein